jgi:type IV pilus assembly protein PilY1
MGRTEMRRYWGLISICALAIFFVAVLSSLADDTCIFEGRTLTKPTSFLSPVLSSRKGVNESGVYLALFLPGSGNIWQGNVVKLRLSSNGSIVDSLGNPAVDADGVILETAVPFWQTKDWADLTKSNGIPNGSRNIYTYLGSSSDLTLVSNDFSTTNSALSAAVLGAPTASPEQIINFVRGADVFDEDSDGDTTENRAVITGDVLHSDPAVFEYLFPDGTSETMVYFGANDGMLHAVLDATVDGDGNETTHGTEAWAFIPPDQLHRLEEMVEGSGHQYYVDSSPKVYFKDVNGNGIIDTNVDSDGDGDVDEDDRDQVILVCGERKGGTGYFALDVTVPESPVFLWRVNRTNDAASGKVGLENVTGTFHQGEPLVFAGGATARVDTVLSADLLRYNQRNGSINAGEMVTGQSSGATGIISFFTYDAPPTAGPDEVIPELGETWSEPQFGLVKTSAEETDKGTPVLFVGGGYSPDNSKGKAILVLRIETGSPLKIFKNWVSWISRMNFSIPSTVALVDDDANGFVDKVYVGDLGGQMWRLGRFTNQDGSPKEFPQADENINHWTGHVLFQANQPSPPTPLRKFFYPPSVTLERGYDLLLTGTGDREDVCASTSYDRIYALKDAHEFVESEAPSGFSPATFNESDLVDVTDPSRPVPNLDSPTADVDENGKLDKGWDIRLGTGEKVLSKGLLLNKVYFVNTYTPSSSGGMSNLYELNYKTGAGKLPPLSQEGAPTRSRVIGGGITAGPVPVLMERGIGLLLAPGEGASEGGEGAGLLAITPPFPPVNFFYLWWMSL